MIAQPPIPLGLNKQGEQSGATRLFFDVQGLKTIHEQAAVILREGLIEHDLHSLVALRDIYRGHTTARQAELQAIERGLARSRPDRPRLHAETLATSLAVIRMAGASSLVDIGCSEGLLSRAAAQEGTMRQVIGLDTDQQALDAARQLMLRTPTKARLEFQHISSDPTELAGYKNFGAIALIEVIEHIPDTSWVGNVLGLQADLVIATTPNRDFNALCTDISLQPNGLRHPGHAFEFNHQEFATWADEQASHYNYQVDLLPLGVADIRHGSAAQMAVFQKN